MAEAEETPDEGMKEFAKALVGPSLQLTTVIQALVISLARQRVIDGRGFARSLRRLARQVPTEDEITHKQLQILADHAKVMSKRRPLR